MAQKGAIVTGVDLVSDNIKYARLMAQELGVSNIDFIESDIMEFKEKHDKKYDMVFTTEGEYHFPFFDKKLPFTFSLKARLITR